MSTFFTLADLKTTPLKNTPVNFVKVYVKENNLKYLNAAGEELDVVLDRPLENFTLPGTASPVTSSDTIATALGKIQATLDSATGIGGTSYVYVAASGTDVENAAELQAAYTTAKTMSPSATNRITIVCGPGNYNFDATTFVMDTQYIDLVSLDGNRSIVFNSSDVFGTLWINKNNIYVKGVDVLTKALCVGTDLNNIVVENCKGGNYSFGFGGNISGTFIDCTAGDNSFASASTTSAPIGVLNNGMDSYASGVFINCTAGQQSFGQSFLSVGVANGTFTNCKATFSSFGSVTIGGGTVAANGIFTNCIAIGSSFAYNGHCGGTFISCTAGGDSWITGNLTGYIYFSRQTSGQTVPTPTAGGKLVAFITSTNQFIAEKP
jgi:hypothetical protein